MRESEAGEDIGLTTESDIEERREPPPPRSAPAFNSPAVVIGAILVLVAVHILRGILGPVTDERLVADFAFIPGCHVERCDLLFDRPGAALWWSPATHALLHGDWTHLGLNAVWLLAFGSPVAARIGSVRFLVFALFGALAGAAAFYILNPTLLEPVIGASGVVSALMGGACRFALSGVSRGRLLQVAAPRLSVAEALSDRTILLFIAIFFATNLVTATAFGSYLSGGAAIAWEAHLGGFAFGFLAFPVFDRTPLPASASRRLP